MHHKDGPRWREKFQLPSVAWWEVPDIIDIDGKSTSQVQFNSPAPPVMGSTAQTGSKQQNNDSARKAEEKPRALSAAEKFEKFKAEGNEFVKKVTIQKKYAFKYELSMLNSLKRKAMNTVKPVLSDHIKQDVFLAFQTGDCLLLHESSAESPQQ